VDYVPPDADPSSATGVTRAEPEAPPPAAAAPAIALPGRFQVIRVIGEGGMGIVVEAHDQALGRTVAVKYLPPGRRDPERRARFAREARAAGALRHPAIVTIHDVDPQGAFIVMELVRGESLAARLHRGAPPRAEARRIAEALLAALEVAHRAGVVHRDVKPANVLLAHDGAVKLADFGIATPNDSDLTATQERVGTPAYMPPEQLRGRVSDPRADVYTAGATLFELYAGRRLHRDDGEPVDARAALRQLGVDRAIAAAVGRATRAAPRERFADAGAFRAALARPPGRGARGLVAIAALGAAAAATAILAGGGGRATPPPARAGAGQVGARPPEPGARAEVAAAIDALERSDVRAAGEHLDHAIRVDPGNADARYLEVVQSWWMSRPYDEVRAAITHADRFPLDGARRAFLAGLRLMLDHNYRGAAGRFADAAHRFPDDRDLLYGRFEALFHGGHPDEAVAVFRRLIALHPHAGLGAIHVLDYASVHGDRDTLAWVLARTGTDGEYAAWPGIALLAAHRPDAAVATLRAGLARLADRPGDARYVRDALAGAYAVRGQLADARALVGDRTGRIQPDLALAWSFALAAGDRRAGAAFEAEFLAQRGIEPPGTGRMMLAETAAMVTLGADRPPADLRRVAARLDHDTPDDRRGELRELVVRTLLACRLHDAARVAAARRAPYDEVVALGDACAAERRGDLAGAGRRVRDALARVTDGRLALLEWMEVARLARARGDAATVRDACARVITPTRVDEVWGAEVGRCRRWIAAAAAARRSGSPPAPAQGSNR
jgi:tetratricopeptide (TPR) repeat protein/predicted Ser/Thr protein kinase